MSIQQDFFLSYVCVSNIIWMPHLNTAVMHKEKAKWKPYKNAVCYYEQPLKATPNKTAAVRLPISHLTNDPSKTNKTCDVLLEKKEQTHKRLSLMDFYTWTRQCRIQIHELKYTTAFCVDVRSVLKDWPWVMSDKYRCHYWLYTTWRCWWRLKWKLVEIDR